MINDMEKQAFIKTLDKNAGLGRLAGTALTIGFPLLTGMDAAKAVRKPMWQTAKNLPQTFNPLGNDLLPY